MGYKKLCNHVNMTCELLLPIVYQKDRPVTSLNVRVTKIIDHIWYWKGRMVCGGVGRGELGLEGVQWRSVGVGGVGVREGMRARQRGGVGVRVGKGVRGAVKGRRGGLG